MILSQDAQFWISFEFAIVENTQRATTPPGAQSWPSMRTCQSMTVRAPAGGSVLTSLLPPFPVYLSLPSIPFPCLLLSSSTLRSPLHAAEHNSPGHPEQLSPAPARSLHCWSSVWRRDQDNCHPPAPDNLLRANDCMLMNESTNQPTNYA